MSENTNTEPVMQVQEPLLTNLPFETALMWIKVGRQVSREKWKNDPDGTQRVYMKDGAIMCSIDDAYEAEWPDGWVANGGSSPNYDLEANDWYVLPKQP